MRKNVYRSSDMKGSNAIIQKGNVLVMAPLVNGVEVLQLKRRPSIWIIQNINQITTLWITPLKFQVNQLEKQLNKTSLLKYNYFWNITWRSPSLSELTPYWISLGLTHLCSEASIYSYKTKLLQFSTFWFQ